MKNCFHFLLIVGVLSVFCKTLLGEPVAISSEEENEEYDYEEGEFHASLEPVDEQEGEDRFFGFKCIKYAGVCTSLCVSKTFDFKLKILKGLSF